MALAELSRRTVLGFMATVVLAPSSGAEEETVLRVAKSPTCGCCGAWVEHMRNAGFKVEVTEMEQDALEMLKIRLGIAPQHASCHTAQIGGYFVEGHVPATDVKRLLNERPDGLGLTTPGMPIGSPGMEMGNERDPYDVLLVRKDRSATVFQSHR